MTFQRELLTIVEIDFPKCSRVYGSSPCTAAVGVTGAEKCYNTRATCQDVPNFLVGDPLTLSFTVNQSGLPKDKTYYPALRSTPSVNAAELNLSGIDPKSTALGKRARVTVPMLDFADADTQTDPYFTERSRNALESGTFFGKLFARNPYFIGLDARIRTGYVGDTVATMPTRYFVTSEATGPNAAGQVGFTFKDILDLADNDKAVAPSASRGKLEEALTIDGTTVTLIPASIGDEYPASGYVAIGREVCAFTRSGDVLTLTARAQFETEAKTHSVNDVAQVCLVYTGQRPCDIVEDLLTTYAGVSASYIDTSAWQSENDGWFGGVFLGTIITKPTGVAQLVGEICQHGFLVWWDDINQEIRFKCNRPLAPGETYFDLTDAGNLLEGSIDIDRPDDKRITVLQFWHGLIDPTDFSEDGAKFKKVVVPINENLYEQERVVEMYSRWFGTTGDDAAASVIAERLADRYRDPPITISGRLDVKDRGDVSLGSLALIDTYLKQDIHGASLPMPAQINRLSQRNDVLEFSAEQYTITGRFAFYLDDPTDDYDAPAADADIEFGAYYMDDTIEEFPDGTGPYVYF